VTFPAFKAGDSVLRGSNGGFDSHTPPPSFLRACNYFCWVMEGLRQLHDGPAKAHPFCEFNSAFGTYSRHTLVSTPIFIVRGTLWALSSYLVFLIGTD